MSVVCRLSIIHGAPTPGHHGLSLAGWFPLLLMTLSCTFPIKSSKWAPRENQSMPIAPNIQLGKLRPSEAKGLEYIHIGRTGHGIHISRQPFH